MPKKKQPAVYLIGNTHFDPVWLWTWDEGMASIRSTFRSALARMEEDSGFRYSFSCVPVFEWIERTEPKMFEEIRRRVAEGRWCLDEGMWLQPDCFTGSGESYVRQCLHGQRYLRKTFGKLSDTAFNADCFGCPEMMPQILSKCRIPYALFGRPDDRDLPLENPLFTWEAPDGSRTLAYRVQDAAAPWKNDLAGDTLPKAVAYSEAHGRDSALIFGVTDHGGAPTKRDIAVIRAAQKEYGEDRVRFSGTTDFFRAQEENADRAFYKGEIPIRFFGVFTDLPDNKREERRAEGLLFSAERLALVEALRDGRKAPDALLASVCEDILFNQFHDIMGGSSIKDAYRDARDRYGRACQNASELLHGSLQRICAGIDLDPGTAGDVDWNLVLFNPHPFPVREPVEAEVQWAWEFSWYEGPVYVTDETGKPSPCQSMDARECIPGFRSRFLFEAEVPALGYRVYRVHRGECPVKSARPSPSYHDGILENDRIVCVLDRKNGGISSVIEKATGKKLLGKTAVPTVHTDESDVWAFNFSGYGDPEPCTVTSVKVMEQGENRVRVRMQLRYGECSYLEEDLLLYAGRSEVELRYRVGWREQQKTLKLNFEKEKAVKLVAETPYGQTVRSFCGSEMPVGTFLTSADGEGDGFTLLLDGIFSYDTEGETVRLSVLRSPIYGDLRMKELDMEKSYDILSQGITEGRLRLIADRVLSGGELPRAAAPFVTPCLTVDEANHPGIGPLCESWLTLTGEKNVVVTALKPAADGSGDPVLRLQNTAGTAASASVRLVSAAETPVLSFAPYEIKTLRLTDGSWKETSMLED